MPSPRRLRLLMLATLVTVVLILFYASKFDDSSADKRSIQDFYHKTMDGMSKGNPPGQAVMDQDGAGPPGDGGSTKERLKAAEEKAKAKANTKALRPDDSAPAAAPHAADDAGTGETTEEHNVEVEMTRILRKSPVIIFSKTFCPYSRRAKELLLEKYNISPAPHVVELDEHPLGRQLQAELGEKTHRRTVPNIMVNGVSLGGSDEIAELDRDGALVAKILDLGSKRVDIKLRNARR
ncbi:hypothetical protein HIM_03870 [Hirsutella minnesotensis 3608]|uniref:Glutaredoxin domain-containing protein n=1 Tax=Hirsutella minnesotensis 3608 TaxID=1043627 RepID=A0A0F8A664_9HYPO|nr:hypothetical protein HIM_03870 [Hirsutella minnesotensis 3608]